MSGKTSIGLGGGTTVIVNVPISEMTGIVTGSMRHNKFIEVTDVRNGRVLWINPHAIKLLQEGDTRDGD